MNHDVVSFFSWFNFKFICNLEMGSTKIRGVKERSDRVLPTFDGERHERVQRSRPASISPR